MKKMMFNDKYGLTQAVLDGRKTMTRRVIPPIVIDWNRRGKVTLPVSGFEHGTLFMNAGLIFGESVEYTAPTRYQPRFKPGEVVAVAQKYLEIEWRNNPNIQRIPDLSFDGELAHSKGWGNKMFVKADLMPHQIRITNVRVERLQDISDEDCLREGIYNWKDAPDCPPGHKDSKIECYGYDGSWDGHLTPITAFAALIDKVSGKGTWESNPYVFVYEFELIK